MKTNGLAKTILIASNSLDDANFSPVAKRLKSRGYKVLLYEADRVADGSVELTISADQENGLRITYNNKPLDLANIAAAWCRRPTRFGYDLRDKSRQMSLDNERKMLLYSLWDMVPTATWLNSPKNLAHAEHKLTQLAAAQQIGFSVPTTLATNRWDAIAERLPENIIFKATFSSFHSAKGPQILYATPLVNKPSELPTHGNPFPGLWQPYFNKAREWRITVVGDQVFDAAIYTDKNAKDDWRKHQDTARVRFERGEFPADEKKKCFAFLQKFGLKFGAFDFIETTDGRIIFLECNPNGQYGWLEDELGLPISQAIADELAAIADRS